MDRVGLLTIHDTMNFGSLLQTFATVSFLKKRIPTVELIDYKCSAIEKRETVLSLRDAKTPKAVLKYVLLHNVLKTKRNNFQSFLQQVIPFSPRYDDTNIYQANDRYDVFIVGSDIVWGTDITGNDHNYFLSFTDKQKKRMSISSSAGKKWGDDTIPSIKNELARFDYICVREHQTSNWIKELIGREVPVTCDPTMLFPAEFWVRFVNPIEKTPKYVLIYFEGLGNENLLTGIDYAKKHNMKVKYINFGKPYPGVENVRPLDPSTWLSLFYAADTVFTASYHGLLFALYFNKNVYYTNWSNKDRMNALSSYLSLEHKENTVENRKIDIPIDYNRVNRLIDSMRLDSIRSIEFGLNCCGLMEGISEDL